MPQHITVLDYNPQWTIKYKEEKKKLLTVLKDNCLAIYHIGSTSIPQSAAKPIIDIMGVVKSLEKVDEVSDEFARIGYESLGEFGIAGRRYFRKGGDERTHQVHIFNADDWTNIVRHLAFRDYLRLHTEEREEYSNLKKELAQCFPYDIEGYCKGKEKFVQDIEKKAFLQYDATWDRLYIAARKEQYDRKAFPLAEAVDAASLITKSGNIYTGTSAVAKSYFRECAESKAVLNMIANGDDQIAKMLIIKTDGKIGMPCKTCRKLIVQVNKYAENIEILSDNETKKSVMLKEIIAE